MTSTLRVKLLLILKVKQYWGRGGCRILKLTLNTVKPFTLIFQRINHLTINSLLHKSDNTWNWQLRLYFFLAAQIAQVDQVLLFKWAGQSEQQIKSYSLRRSTCCRSCAIHSVVLISLLVHNRTASFSTSHFSEFTTSTTLKTLNSWKVLLYWTEPWLTSHAHLNKNMLKNQLKMFAEILHEILHVPRLMLSCPVHVAVLPVPLVLRVVVAEGPGVGDQADWRSCVPPGTGQHLHGTCRRRRSCGDVGVRLLRHRSDHFVHAGT